MNPKRAIRSPYVLFLVFLAIAAPPAAAWDFSVNVNGNTITVTVGGGLSGTQCCAGASIDDPNVGGAQCSVPCGDLTHSIFFTCNSVGTHTVYATVSDSSTGYVYETKQQTVTVSTPPDPICPSFDLVSPGNKVLTHKYGDQFGDTYPYPKGQTTDGEIKFTLRTRAAEDGTTVYLKVLDPEDTALYGAPHQKDDNIDTARGIIANGGKTGTATLPGNGTVDFVLKTTLNASGDNYQVQATTDPALVNNPNYVCAAASKCYTSPVITAWKRMYLEIDDMYRNSQLIAKRTLVGESLVYVNDRGFRRGDNVRLIHAPSFSRDQDYDVNGFYSEDRVVLEAARNTNADIPAAYVITLDAPLANAYYTDLTVGSTKLGDAIVNLSRNAEHSADPAFHVSEQYVVGAFQEAFVDVIRTPTSDVTLPLYDAMTDLDRVYVGGKWFAARTGPNIPDNFGLAVAAATRTALAGPNQVSLGTTGGAYSYVWRKTIDDATSGPRSRFPMISGLNPDSVGGEVLVHELAHQWMVNPSYPGNECNRNSYADASKFCQGNGPNNSGQYDDGLVKFHYVGTSPATADSEYITMRKATEPKP